MELNNNIVSLRAVEPTDLDFLFILESAEGTADYGFSTGPVSRQLIWEYIDSYNADIYAAKQLRLVITAAGIAVGAIDISDFDARHRRGFVGVVVDEKYRRRGYAGRALQLLCDYARNTLAMKQLVAIAAVDNEASLKLFSSAGFKQTATLKEWLCRGGEYADAILLQKLL
ncbi:MAG: GNAT family N-acetyltransferase [Muribaculaceae bacterium]|nr:GNAT family N-acetyltransferase [Muribaculaceae bacterium]